MKMIEPVSRLWPLAYMAYRLYTSLATYSCFKTKDFSHECEAKDVEVLLFKIKAPFNLWSAKVRHSPHVSPMMHQNRLDLR